jgi:hypothetical protein
MNRQSWALLMWAVVASTVSVLAAVGLRGPLRPLTHRLHPKLSAARPNKELELQVSIDAQAFVYLFDELNGWVSPVLAADGTPWEPGTFSSEGGSVQMAGDHRIVVLACSARIDVTEPPRQLDEATAEALGCELAEARVHIDEGTTAPPEPTSPY